MADPAAIPEMTVETMREILWDEVHKLREGETSAATANGVANLMGKIMSTVKAQMEYFRLTGQTPNIPMLAAPTKKP